MRGMALGLLVLVGTPAMAELEAYSGKILYNSEPFPAGGTMEFKKALNKALARTELAGKGGVWNFHFVAAFRKPPGSTDINLVFYDVTGGKREYVNVYEIKVAADQTSLLSQVVLTKVEGFAAGRKYRALVTRLIDGKEVIYAKGLVKLK